jgi:hypothetical protein
MKTSRVISILCGLLLLLQVVLFTNTIQPAEAASQRADVQQRSRRAGVRRRGRRMAARITFGVIENNSSRDVWITADNKKYCLKAGQKSTDIGIQDADGLLLDGTPVLFDSNRTDLGGGKVWSSGAIKVCDPGKMTVENGAGPVFVLKVTISTAGFLCPSDSAGYKTPEWCSQHPGWDINNTPLARPC